MKIKFLSLVLILFLLSFSAVCHAGDRENARQEFDDEVNRMYDPLNTRDEDGFYGKMLGEADSLVRLNDGIEKSHFSEDSED